MRMVDSQPRSSSNRASMDGTGDEKEKEVEAPELVPTCWGYPKAYSYPKPNICTTKKSSLRSLANCLQWRRWPPLISQLLPLTSLHFLPLPLQPTPAHSWLAFGGSSRAWRNLRLLQFLVEGGEFSFLPDWKVGKIFGLCFLCLSCNVQDLGDILGSWREENLEFLQNSWVCSCERTVLPGCLI